MNKNARTYTTVLTAIVFATSLPLMNNCSSSKVSGNGSSAFSNPDAIQFTPDHMAYMLRLTYSNFNARVPQSDLDSILEASDDDAAEEAYQAAIDKFVDTGTMENRWKQYARDALNVGTDEDNEDGEISRYPENLWAKVLLSGDKINEFILADYAIDDNGSEVTQVFDDGRPNSILAGYITMEPFEAVYMNEFMFKMVREVVNFNLCDTAPYSRVTLQSWTQDEINEKYIESGGTFCFACHTNNNPIRYAWHQFNGGNQEWTGDDTRGNDQYGMEPDGDGSGNLVEPRNSNGTPMDETEAEQTMYKLTPDGEILESPRVLAQEIAKNNRYPRCMVERFFSVFFNLDEGHPGQNYVVPDHFSGNEAQIAFLDKWTDTFNELGQVPKEFFKEFLKSNDYLILGYNPEEE